MKTIILTVLAAVTFAFAGIAGAEQDRNSVFPEGSVQHSPE